jgi:tetratricopeptide (TPR) repeat protein
VSPHLLRWIAPASVISLLWLATGCNNINSQALNSEGVRLYQQGNYQQASVRFQEAIAHDPQAANGYYNLAASLHKAGTMYNRPADVRQAEVLYNQCLERDPNHSECYRGLAVLLTETGRQQEAFRLLTSWTQMSPDRPEPFIELARLYEESGRAQEAKDSLIAALTVDPNNARALTALGRLRDQSGEHNQALANYQRSLEINRFQPDVAARVATLNAANGGVPTVIATQPGGTRVGKNSWQPSVKY